MKSKMKTLCRRAVLPVLFMLLLTAPADAANEAAPAFGRQDRADWINTEPLDWSRLHGKVVLLNVWTFGCSNCRGSLAWLKALYATYHEQGFEIVGIHSPEFAWEKPRPAVASAVREHGIEWPVMLDNDLKYWDALDNRYWPAFYLVDAKGRIAGRFVGETHAGDLQAGVVESLLAKLLSQRTDD